MTNRKMISRRSFLKAAGISATAMGLAACGSSSSVASSQPADSKPAGSVAADGKVPQPAGYPGSSINLIVPVKAGAALDLNMRAMADRIDLGGAEIVVQNIAGASQTIGIAQGADSKPDGNTIVVCGPAGNLIQPHLIDVPYSPDSFSYIANPFGPVPAVISVLSDSKYKTMDDLIAAMKNGENLKYSTSTAGSVAHISSLYVWDQLGVSPTHVPYNGTAEAVNAVLSGEIDFCMMDHSVVKDHVASGTMRGLVISWTSAETDRYWPADMPTLQEDYKLADIQNYGGFAMLAVPKGTPDDIVAWLCQEFEAFFTSDEWNEYLGTIGRAGYELYVGEEMDAMCRTMFDGFGAAIDEFYVVE